MLRVFELRLPLNHTAEDLCSAVAASLEVPSGKVLSWEIRRQAIDARNRRSIHLIYTVDVEVEQEEKLLARGFSRRIIAAPDERYQPAEPGSVTLKESPVVVGCGPAGLFAGLILAQAGYRPLILERGKALENRCVDVDRLWRDGVLNAESNAQFGEGGAGAFSDGKLTTLVNDSRIRKVLEEFVAAGAPRDILSANKPHVGTDRLRGVVRNLRSSIIRHGGTVRFLSKVTNIRTVAGRLAGLEINHDEEVACNVAVLAIGHSARDTFRLLYDLGVTMTPKPFSIGLRLEHPQHVIDEAQYGPHAGHPRLGAAEYKFAYHAASGRSAYTFCMCPGGEVIAATSEPGAVVTNGMSFRARNGVNGNAALLVNVEPADFADDHPLAGFLFQKEWEVRAFLAGGDNYSAPVQLLEDFMAHRRSDQLGRVKPSYRPGVVLSDLNQCLPAYVCETLKEAVPVFGLKLRGFDLPDAILTGVETRSSCPVRLLRRQDYQSSIDGLYPAGEGAGYAGGIMSSAVDGIRVAEAVIDRFACTAS